MKITKIHYNWFYTIGEEEGEGYQEAEVGKKGVTKIVFRDARGEGDKAICNVYYECGKSEIIFNINKIFQTKDD